MRFVGLLTVASLSAISPAFAAEIPVTSKIDSVTVFPSGAEVARTLKVKLEPGEHTLIANDISAKADASSIRIEVSGTEKVEIGSVDARNIELSSNDPAVAQSERKKIEDQIQALRDQDAAQADIINVAELQQAYLNKLANLPEQSAAKSETKTGNGTSTETDWRGVFTVIGESMMEVKKNIAAAKLKQREIALRIEDLQKQLRAVESTAENRTQVRIHVNAKASVETTLIVRYQVKDASWTASYDARLATGDVEKAAQPSLALIRRATIEQSSAEDWDGVTLTLSTARPTAKNAAPKLRTLIADFDPNPQAAAATPLGDLNDQDPSKAKTRSGSTAVQFVHAFPGRMTVKASGDGKQVQIGSETVQPALFVRSVPRVDETAFLYSHFTLPKTSEAVLPGAVSLFRDGVFVGNGKLPRIVPGEEQDLGFGVDERVEMRRAILEIKKGETGTYTSGTYSTSFVDTRRYAIEFKNLHTYPVDVQVIDRAPVALQQDIKVEFNVDTGPQPTIKDLDNHRGTYLWQMKADPNEQKQIVFSYRVTLPQGKRVLYREPTQEDMQSLLGK
jgi:hypothetical protein